MPRESTRERAGTPIELKPIGASGLNLNDDPSMLEPGEMRQARNVDATRRTYARRMGDAKVSLLTDQAAAHGAKVFGTIAKYATWPGVLIPAGGFGAKWHFTAVRGAGVTWLLDSRQSMNGADYPLRITLSAAGLLEVIVTWSDLTQTVLVTTALGASSSQNALLIFDPIAGTLTLYLDGEIADQETGLAATKRPYQSVAYPWYFSASFNPTVGVTATTPFLGALDAFTLFTFTGLDLADADATLTPPRLSVVDTLRESPWQDWPCPEGTMVLAHFGMDEATAGTGPMYDSSDRQLHGTYFGSPANANRIALRAQNGNFLGTTRRASVGALEDGRVNIAVAAGQHYYEMLRAPY